MLPKVSASALVFLLILFVRSSSVFLVQTWFVPDEYWQSLEIAHRLSFGYGYLTWEWFAGIRSWIYPLSIALVYKQLEFFQLDNPVALVYAPRVLQALLTTWAEWTFVKALMTTQTTSQILWFVLLQLGSYFMYYVGSRTLANTLEMNCALLGIASYINKKKGSFLFYVTLSCYIRPTCAPLWFPFALSFIKMERPWLRSSIGLKVVAKCLILACFLVWLDSWWYGKFTIVPLQFLLFNFVNDLSGFYGEHTWHWYLTNALPSLMGPTLIPILKSLVTFQANRERKPFLLCKLAVICYIVFHSLVGHKEIRFLTPLIPLLNLMAAKSIYKWRWKKLFAVVFILCNISATWYLSLRHQRGVMDAIEFLRFRLTPNDSVLFLMPCHSTPFYSHIHINASLQFLGCPPNLSNRDNYTDEADVFYHQPEDWLLANASTNPPGYLMIFDPLLGRITDYLDSFNYELIGNFFHADVDQGRVGRRVLVFTKTS